MSLMSSLGAGRIDPFDIYYEKSPPVFVHEIVDHALNSAAKAYIPSDRQADFSMARSNLMDNMMTQPLVWYSAMMSSMTHYAFVKGHKIMPKDHEIMRLSYRTKTLGLLQEDIRDHGGLPSEQGMLAISTLIVHGGTQQDADRFMYDDFNVKKAFGRANDMHYYTSIYLDTSHWPALARFVKLRGGAGNVKLAPMAGVFAISDSCIAWRTLSKPSLDPFVPTSVWISMAAYKPDAAATAQEKKYLSGLPEGLKSCEAEPYSKLYQCLVNTRTTIVRYNQYERRYTQPQFRPDVKHIHFTRILIMHDLLNLPILVAGSSETNNIYEILRHSVLAFMQLVLFPLASTNDMPNRLLQLLVPLLRVTLATLQQQPQPASVTTAPNIGTLDLNLFLYIWMLSGMLALENLQTKGKSEWMDELAPLIEHMAIKAEKSAWSMVRGVMETFLWLDSECDSVGQRWWNYACLWVAARKVEMQRDE